MKNNILYKTNTLRYIFEQTSTGLENNINRLKKLIDVYNKLSEEDKNAIGEKPDEGNGKSFWDKTESILSEIQKDQQSQESKKYAEEHKDEIAKAMYDIKEITSQYPDTYNASTIKPLLDTVTVESLPKQESPDQKTTPSSGEQKPEETKTASTGTSEKKPEETYAKDYTGVSIVDFLNQSGKPSDFESRKKLAQSLGIQNYTGTASQNTEMLNKLRGGKQYSDGIEVQKAELAKPYTTPKEGKGPTIRYGQMEYPAYIDMGGGKYRLAKQEELDNPNMQLYIPNPKKGQQEYGKPNFVKVRREGGDIRRQSQFGGAIGSASNLFGDIGNTLAKPFRK